MELVGSPIIVVTFKGSDNKMGNLAIALLAAPLLSIGVHISSSLVAVLALKS